MLKYLNVLFITFLTLSCGSSTIEMDPLLKDKSLIRIRLRIKNVARIVKDFKVKQRTIV